MSIDLNNMTNFEKLIIILFPFCLSVALASGYQIPTNRTFVIHPTKYTFMKDGVPFRYISGSLHYFRIPMEYWTDRLVKAKAVGLDTIQLYIPWNFHEWEEGEFNFAGDRDVEHFIDLIAQLDLLAIVRVGPYICAEWSFGGLPPWLLRKNPIMRIRSSDPDYYTHVLKWFNVLFPKLRRFLYTNGGPIIMVQLENEYGSSTICDNQYMSMLYDLARRHLGPDIVLFTTDGNGQHYLQCGSPDQRYLATVDFGPTRESVNDSFRTLDRFRPKQPWINSEFYVGWFDHWGDKHAHAETASIISSLTKLLGHSMRVNVNLYVLHGGTNFGFWNGDPGDGPVVTSYDFAAPLNEAGDMTEKYMALRQTIHEMKKTRPPSLPSNTTKASYGKITMQLYDHMLANLVPGNNTLYPLHMEAFHVYEGYLVYITELPESNDSKIKLTFERFADVAHLYTSDQSLKNLTWHVSLKGPYAETFLDIEKHSHPSRLVVMVENTGYINYGDRMWNDVKGVVGNVTFEGKPLRNWDIMFVPDLPGRNVKKLPTRPRVKRTSADVSAIRSAEWPVQGSMYLGTLHISDTTRLHDTFIQPDSFSRGVIYINGRNIGRYNQKAGPQLRLFVPKPILRTGANRIVVMELENISRGSIQVSFHAESLLNASKLASRMG